MDGLVIMHFDTETNNLKVQMQSDLIIVNEWLKQNKLTMNTKKTKCMLIRNQTTIHENLRLNLIIDQTPVEQVKSYRYLGLMIQEDLKWDNHVELLARRVTSFCGVINRIGGKVNNSILISIYYAHIHSTFTYLLPIWGPTAPSFLLDWLQICQNNAIRRVFATEYYNGTLNTSQLMTEIKILNSRNSIELESSSLYYKIIHNLIKLNDEFKRNANNHDYNTRHRMNAIATKYRSNVGRKSVLRNSVSSFNRLSTDLQKAINLRTFRACVKNAILATQ